MRTTDARALARSCAFCGLLTPGPVLLPAGSELFGEAGAGGWEVRSYRRESSALASGTYELHWRAHTHSSGSGVSFLFYSVPPSELHRRLEVDSLLSRLVEFNS